MNAIGSRPLTGEEKRAARAKAKLKHDTALTFAWPAVRRPRTPAEVPTGAFLDGQRERVRGMKGATREGVMRALGVSWRRAARLLRSVRA